MAETLKMTSTRYDSPHGLQNIYNLSCAKDLAILANQCMQNPDFCTIVASQVYECSPLNDDDHVYEWVNTNRLLTDSPLYTGCKTGITDAAGPCLAASYYNEKNGEVQSYIVILLASKTIDTRWDEVPVLIDWAIQKQKLSDCQKTF